MDLIIHCDNLQNEQLKGKGEDFCYLCNTQTDYKIITDISFSP